MTNIYRIIIISEDNIFIALIKKIIEINISNIELQYFKSYSEIKDIPISYKPDLVIIDDVISGSASYELVTYLRLEKKVLSPIYYFSNSENEAELKALKRGVNLFQNKPFNPTDVIENIKLLLQKNKL